MSTRLLILDREQLQGHQVLAQILPGFRDFRTPLVTGYVWLIILWILVGMPIPSKDEKTGILGLINSSEAYLTPAAYLAVISFAAYMIGILLTIDFSQATALVHKYGFRIEWTLNEKGKSRPHVIWHKADTAYRKALNRKSEATLTKVLWAAMRRVELRDVPWTTVYRTYNLMIPSQEVYDERSQELYGDGGEPELKRRLRKEGLREAALLLYSEMDDEISTLATQLQEKSKELFSSYDRERSEAEFRLSLAIPIAVLSIQALVLSFAGGQAMGVVGAVLGLIVAAVLLRKGWTKILEATNVVATALDIGVVSSQVIEKLDGLSGPFDPAVTTE